MSSVELIDKCIEFINKSADNKSADNKCEICCKKNEGAAVKNYILDGRNFNNLEGFWDEFEAAIKVNKSVGWGRNEAAMVDKCRDLPKPCVIIWKNSNISKSILNHDYRAKDLKQCLNHGCHPENYEIVKKLIIDAENGKATQHLMCL